MLAREFLNRRRILLLEHAQCFRRRPSLCVQLPLVRLAHRVKICRGGTVAELPLNLRGGHVSGCEVVHLSSGHVSVVELRAFERKVAVLTSSLSETINQAPECLVYTPDAVCQKKAY